LTLTFTLTIDWDTFGPWGRGPVCCSTLSQVNIDIHIDYRLGHVWPMGPRSRLLQYAFAGDSASRSMSTFYISCTDVRGLTTCGFVSKGSAKEPLRFSNPDISSIELRTTIANWSTCTTSFTAPLPCCVPRSDSANLGPDSSNLGPDSANLGTDSATLLTTYHSMKGSYHKDNQYYTYEARLGGQRGQNQDHHYNTGYTAAPGQPAFLYPEKGRRDRK